MTTSAPKDASLRAMAAPMPRLEPVTARMVNDLSSDSLGKGD